MLGPIGRADPLRRAAIGYFKANPTHPAPDVTRRVLTPQTWKGWMPSAGMVPRRPA